MGQEYRRTERRAPSKGTCAATRTAREILRIGVRIQRLETMHKRANNKHGSQRLWDPQHCAGAEGVEAESQRRFKKTEKTTSRVNLWYIAGASAVEAEMVLWKQVEAAELDEMWSFVGNKGCWCAGCGLPSTARPALRLRSSLLTRNCP